MERIEKLKEFLQANPTDSFLQHALALEYIKKGNDEDARRLFEEILNREPGYVGSYYHLAKLLERMEQTNEAIAAAVYSPTPFSFNKSLYVAGKIPSSSKAIN